jgi:hypothetical protein
MVPLGYEPTGDRENAAGVRDGVGAASFGHGLEKSRGAAILLYQKHITMPCIIIIHTSSLR